MSFNPFAVVLHGGAAASMAYGFQGLSQLVIHSLIQAQKGGHFQFLTIQGLAIALATAVVSLLADLAPSFTPLRKLKRVLTMVSMPISVIVSVIYWTLILFAPALILQKDITKSTPTSSPETLPLARLPILVDLAMHAVPTISLLADFFLLEKKYSPNAANYGAPLVVGLATLWYGSSVEYFASFNGAFPYPFLTENPLPIRIAIYIAAGGLGLSSFWAINGAHK